MMPRVTGVFDEKIEAQGFDKIRSIVEVDLVDGRMLVQPSDDRYRGGPGQPVHARGTAREVRRLRAAGARRRIGSAPAFNAIESVDSMAGHPPAR